MQFFFFKFLCANLTDRKKKEIHKFRNELVLFMSFAENLLIKIVSSILSSCPLKGVFGIQNKHKYLTKNLNWQ